jgi:hypothetical protein
MNVQPKVYGPFATEAEARDCLYALPNNWYLEEHGWVIEMKPAPMKSEVGDGSV